MAFKETVWRYSLAVTSGPHNPDGSGFGAQKMPFCHKPPVDNVVSQVDDLAAQDQVLACDYGVSG